MIILSAKLRNQFPSVYQTALRNVSINGDKRGCSGFISHNGNIVYVNTEPCFNLGLMYRTAESTKDYTGGVNHWAHNLEELVAGVNNFLKGE